MLVYVVLTSGVHLHLHYCCGKLAELNLFRFEDKCCSHDSHESCAYHKNCCEYEEFSVKLDGAQHAPKVFVFDSALPESNEYCNLTSFHSNPVQDFNDNIEGRGPPGTPYYLLNCSLVLYA